MRISHSAALIDQQMILKYRESDLKAALCSRSRGALMSNVNRSAQCMKPSARIIKTFFKRPAEGAVALKTYQNTLRYQGHHTHLK